MKEINEREYLMNLGDVPMIVWARYPHESYLDYSPAYGNGDVLKRTSSLKGIFRRNVTRRFFLLTEEEIITMVLPRLI